MAPTESVRRERVLGLPVDCATMAELVEVAAAAIAERRRCDMLVTNANKCWQAARDPRLRRLLEAADVVVPEWALEWAGARLDRRGIRHIGGLTLMRRLLEEAAARGWSVYLLGGKPAVAERLARKLAAERPGLRLAGWHHGYLSAEDTRTLHARLAELRPDLLFVGMGSPLQEYWIGDLPDGTASVRLGVGGSFDVLAGVKRDAPSWARGRGLEWLYRLAQDPARYGRRYLVTNSWFVWSVLRERMRGSPGRTAPVRTAAGSGA